MKKEITNETNLWVSSIRPEVIDGESYIPTALFFENDELFWGRNALEKGLAFNTNFKLDLGDLAPKVEKHKRKQIKLANGKTEDAFFLCKNYIDVLLGNVDSRFPANSENNFKHPAKIIIAEPLAFQVEGRSKQWNSNYRSNMRRILFRYEAVDFLPEPFAVYQYYRYGLRLPQLMDTSKQIALIIDFGGGTFDACVIESTSAGDVSQRGKHSKPLSADSIPVGGFFINEKISEYLIKLNLDQRQKGDAERCIKQYYRVKKGDLDVSDLKESTKKFIENLTLLNQDVEIAKIKLTNLISDWSLENEGYEKVLVKVPCHPFTDNSTADAEFYAHMLRKIITDDIWEKNLKRVVKNVLGIARKSLGAKDITTTLISGGSANIRWLQELIERDFDGELGDALPVPISGSFQDVVANGLAIECARRHFSGESEFVAVTYNPIKLHLNPDGNGVEEDRRFLSMGDKIDMSTAKPADLIPSAQSLHHFFGKELFWKVKLSKHPKHYLEYEFFKQADERHTYNVEEKKVITRDSRHFDKQIQVSLIVKEDGTAVPKFIYKKANPEFGVEENAVQGKPFYIDMTSDAEQALHQTYYVGLDFGSSNSSVCTLSKKQIKLTKTRNDSSKWRGLAKAVNHLPFPVSYPIRTFLSKSEPEEIAKSAREAFEAGLLFLAYLSASELSQLNSLGGILKNFQHRSMGPLKALLEQCSAKAGANAPFCQRINKSITRHKELINKGIKDFTDHKHEKLAADSVNWMEYLEVVAKVLSEVLINCKFGYSMKCDEVFLGGEFEVTFKIAHDNAPFVENIEFRSDKSINSNIALLVDIENKRAISLSPLFFWWDENSGKGTPDCYCFDKQEAQDFCIKPCDKHTVRYGADLNPNITKVFSDLINLGKPIGQTYELTFK